MGNTAALARVFRTLHGPGGLSTLRDLDALEKAEMAKVKKLNATKMQTLHFNESKDVRFDRLTMNMLRKFLSKRLDPMEDQQKQRKRWMRKWRQRFGELSPTDIPYCMDSAGGFKYPFYLDKKTFGATNFDWGTSGRPKVIEWAYLNDFDCFPILLDLAVDQNLTAKYMH